MNNQIHVKQIVVQLILRRNTDKKRSTSRSSKIRGKRHECWWYYFFCWAGAERWQCWSLVIFQTIKKMKWKVVSGVIFLSKRSAQNRNLQLLWSENFAMTTHRNISLLLSAQEKIFTKRDKEKTTTFSVKEQEKRLKLFSALKMANLSFKSATQKGGASTKFRKNSRWRKEWFWKMPRFFFEVQRCMSSHFLDKIRLSIAFYALEGHSYGKFENSPVLSIRILALGEGGNWG